MVTQAPQNSINVFFQNFLLELKEEILQIFEVEEAEITLVEYAENRNGIELFHSLEGFLLNLDLDVIVDLLFEES